MFILVSKKYKNRGIVIDEYKEVKNDLLLLCVIANYAKELNFNIDFDYLNIEEIENKENCEWSWKTIKMEFINDSIITTDITFYKEIIYNGCNIQENGIQIAMEVIFNNIEGLISSHEVIETIKEKNLKYLNWDEIL